MASRIFQGYSLGGDEVLEASGLVTMPAPEVVATAENPVDAVGLATMSVEAVGTVENPVDADGLVTMAVEAVGTAENPVEAVGLITMAAPEVVGTVEVVEDFVNVFGLITMSVEVLGTMESAVDALGLVTMAPEAIGTAEAVVDALGLVTMAGPEAVGVAVPKLPTIGLITMPAPEALGAAENPVDALGIVTMVLPEGIGAGASTIDGEGLVTMPAPEVVGTGITTEAPSVVGLITMPAPQALGVADAMVSGFGLITMPAIAAIGTITVEARIYENAKTVVQRIMESLAYNFGQITVENGYRNTIRDVFFKMPTRDQTINYPAVVLLRGRTTIENQDQSDRLWHKLMPVVAIVLTVNQTEHEEKRWSLLGDVETYFGRNHVLRGEDGRQTCLLANLEGDEPFGMLANVPRSGFAFQFAVRFRQDIFDATVLS